MRALALLWGCLALRASAALTCPKEMSGFEGDTVTLRCTYESELRTHPKYWCREVGVFISRCSSKIFSGENSQDVMEGRVSIRDSPGELALVVSLRGLTLKDSGKYWCGAQRLGPDEACPVSLTVVPATAPEATAPEATAPDAAAASPPAGSSRPTTQPDSSSSAVGDPGPASSSHSSMPSVSIPTTRLLAPILVLLALLLAAGLIALSTHMLWGWRQALWAEDAQRGEKVHLPAAGVGSPPAALPLDSVSPGQERGAAIPVFPGASEDKRLGPTGGGSPGAGP
ncbi:CMRF35-like molecule 9 isoform X4 [Heterocephalus glaber]|uniref:CMRF35-like molecule 9 isoform X4 n=1 Tax=Heterocephalus glaber TaxID=10181 RepID=A0AAX6R4B5_HETGA|nr:CMRF35-like molecule 9 isoform X4 [Heterocephalus glaber]